MAETLDPKSESNSRKRGGNSVFNSTLSNKKFDTNCHNGGRYHRCSEIWMITEDLIAHTLDTNEVTHDFQYYYSRYCCKEQGPEHQEHARRQMFEFRCLLP